MEISEGGFSAMLTEEFQIGEAVEVSFELPSTGHITMDATVRNKNLFLMARSGIGTGREHR